MVKDELGSFDKISNRISLIVGILGGAITALGAVGTAASGLTGLAIVIAASTVIVVAVPIASIVAAPTDAVLAVAGRVGLVITLVLYSAGLLFLWFAPAADREPISWISVGLVGVLLAVQSSIVLRKSRLEASYSPPAIDVALRFSQVTAGAALLGVAASGLGSAIIEAGSDHVATAVALSLQALIVGATGLAIMIERRAVVCQALVAAGIAQVGFGIAAVAGRSVVFGIFLCVLGVCGALLGVLLWKRRLYPSAVVLGGAALASALLAAAAAIEVGKPAFAVAFAILTAALLGLSLITFFVKRDGQYFRHHDQHDAWPLAAYFIWGSLALGVAVAAFLAVADVYVPLRSGDRWAAMGVLLAALFVAVSTFVAYGYERRGRQRKLVEAL